MERVFCDVNDPGNPFYHGTATSHGLRTVTVTGAGWTTNQWKGYEIKRDTANTAHH